MDLDYTPSELMAVAGARELRDGEIVAVGLGLPVVASFLAKKTHAPNMTMLFELGVIDPEPIHCGVGLADPRVWYRAKVLSSFVDILGAILHKGRVDVGFLGGLEVDQYGNLNTTLVGDPRAQFRHMIGSGGANDIASCAQRTIIIMRHEARKLKQAISFVTSPGYVTGGDSRAQAGSARWAQPGDHGQGHLRIPPRDQANDARIDPPRQHVGRCARDHGLCAGCSRTRPVYRAADEGAGAPDP